jgi:hypothetical protein
LRDGYLGRCSAESLALYVLLVCASDAQGLSYYSEPRIAELLGLELAALRSCRQQLISLGLIAYQKPLYQLLNLEEELLERSGTKPESDPTQCNSRSDRVGSVTGVSLKTMVERLLEQQRSGRSGAA